MKTYPLLFSLFLLASCSNRALQERLTNTQRQLEHTQSKLNKFELNGTGELIHVVYFKLKKDADVDALIAEIQKLESIEGVDNLEVGLFEDLGDTRALAEYGLVMQMDFKDKDAYKAYQAHPRHLALKENAKQYLAGPPATYDFIKR